MSGGFTSSFYTAMWRNTKDMDLWVLPEDRESMIEATREAGLHDLYDEKPYDRRWIYRSTRDGIIVDIIWKLANMQRERCAWTDIINMLYATGAGFDWNRLIGRLVDEERLLSSVLLLFSWIAPGRARKLPE
jgi:hypothetical protein